MNLFKNIRFVYFLVQILALFTIPWKLDANEEIAGSQKNIDYEQIIKDLGAPAITKEEGGVISHVFFPKGNLPGATVFIKDNKIMKMEWVFTYNPLVVNTNKIQISVPEIGQAKFAKLKLSDYFRRINIDAPWNDLSKSDRIFFLKYLVFTLDEFDEKTIVLEDTQPLFQYLKNAIPDVFKVKPEETFSKKIVEAIRLLEK